MVKTLKLDTSSIEYAILPEHVKDDVPDRISIMLIQEENEYGCFDYLAANEAVRKKVSKPVDEDCRVKMCEWCYQVVDFCKFRRETVGIGMSYLDRYMCSSKGTKALGDRKEYQLVAMTCLYIAIKLHEPLEMETSLLADLSRGCYTEMEFANMEQNILEAIDWRVSGPTPLAFVLHYLAFLPNIVPSPVMEAIFDYARYQIELGIADHSFVKSKPSVVGMAALLNALEGMDSTLLPDRIHDRLLRTIIMYTSIDLDEVEIIQMRLSAILFTLLDDSDVRKYEKLVEDSDEDDDDDDSVDLSDDEDYDDDVESDDSESDDETSHEDYDYDDDEEEKNISPPTNHRSPTSVMRKSKTRK
uniref:Cyclin-like domain-containing protein n=1 Tax=Pseudo-nitzschia australis TaxID=44445 RepID=A0A7S4EJ60_9STRA|mmetsp:Transcript_139/g.358  ORF Transcript_139/g.358 Transcript_139/m.358 type:complete len:358 (-) Transcript_139:237-1310(-)